MKERFRYTKLANQVLFENRIFKKCDLHRETKWLTHGSNTAWTINYKVLKASVE